MIKLMAWTSKAVFGAIVVTAISIFTTYYTVQMYVNEILKQFHIETAEQRLELKNFIVSLAGGWSGNSWSEAPADPPASVPSYPDEEAQPVWTPLVVPQEQPAVPTEEQARPTMAMTSEQFQQAKDAMSNEDKMKIFSLLITRIPPSDIQKISWYIEDGLTADELLQISAIVEQHLLPEEYVQLVGILEKY